MMSIHIQSLVNSGYTNYMEKFILNLALKIKLNFMYTLLSVWNFAFKALL